MKISKCYSCSSEQHNFYAEENGYSLVKCDVCGLLFVENRPDDNEIVEAIKQGKHPGVKELDVTGRYNPLKISNYIKVLEELYNKDLGGIKTWLDIGCGHGEFIMAIQKYSHGRISARGSEPNVHKQESARERGLDVGFFDIESHEEKYDAISLLNVYSHLPDPPMFLELLKKLLKPGGELILQTGDAADLSVKDIPKPFLLPGHLSFASEKIVTGILERLGFDIIKVNKYPLLDKNFKSFAVELAKAILPNHVSLFKYYFKGKMPQIDMYIRARIKS